MKNKNYSYKAIIISTILIIFTFFMNYIFNTLISNICLVASSVCLGINLKIYLSYKDRKKYLNDKEY